MAAMKMNEEMFRQAMGEEMPVLVEFMAPWCVYCRRIAPALDKVAQQNEGRVKVAAVNIDESPALAEAERIEVVPTLILFRNGKAVDSIAAPESKAQIDAFLREALEG